MPRVFLMLAALLVPLGAAAAQQRAGAPAAPAPASQPRQRLDIGPQDPSLGPARAPVTIVEFADFECPFCKRLWRTLQRVRETYGDRVRIVWKDFPLTRVHPAAFQAAVAARCAFEQGRFWEYHDRLFEGQRALGVAALKVYAQDAGLNVDRYAACVDSNRYETAVQDSMAAARRLGLTGTPTIFINGLMIKGAKPYEVYAAAIDDELAHAPKH